MPLAAQRMAGSGRYDAIVALGAVIRGGTPHFEYVAGECTKGLAQVNLQSVEAALSAIEMVNLLRELD